MSSLASVANGRTATGLLTSRLKWPVALLVLLTMSKAVLMLLLTRGERATIDLAEGSALYQVLAAACFVAATAYCAVEWRTVLGQVSRQPLMTALLILVAASTAWSLQPGITARRTLALYGTTACALFITSSFSFADFGKLMRWFFVLIIVASAAFLMAAPDLAIHSDEFHAGNWRGAFTHKNNLGEAMAIASLVFVLSAVAREVRLERALVWVAAALAMLVMSGSKASVLALLAAMLVLPALSAIRLRLALRLPLGIAAFLVVSVVSWNVVTHFETILSAFGRDLTLTGRTLLWQAAVLAGLDHPLLGVGYRAFWLGEEGGIGLIGSLASHFALTIDHGHNGFLDLWLELGIPGLVLFIAFLVVMLRNALRFASSADSAFALMPLMFIVLLLPISFASTVILDRNNFIWILFLCLAIYARESQHHAGPAPSSASSSCT